MAHVEEHADFDFESPVLVEGLPGVGLVGKIAADHLVDAFGMDHVASVHCEGVPRVAVYAEDEYTVRPPIRIYGDEKRDLLVLQSDVPVSPQTSPEFAGCLTGWFEETDILPICLSGLPEEKDGVPEMYGIGTGEGSSLLSEHDIEQPSESGMVSGPTGALLAEAGEREIDGIGLIVQANAQFPDPEAARILLVEGIEPVASVDVETQKLIDQAEEIADARERLAKQMQQAQEQESSQAKPLGMYQ